MQQFADWYNQEKARGTDWTTKLPDCPCVLDCWKVRRSRGIRFACYGFDFYVWYEIHCANPDPKIWHDPKGGAEVGIWHPGASNCMRSHSTPSGAGQQCCYDADGQLITGGGGAGMPDLVSPDNPGHVKADVEAFNIATYLDEHCTMFPQFVDMYIEVRPPNQGKDSEGKPCQPNSTPGHPKEEPR